MPAVEMEIHRRHCPQAILDNDPDFVKHRSTGNAVVPTTAMDYRLLTRKLENSRTGAIAQRLWLDRPSLLRQ